MTDLPTLTVLNKTHTEDTSSQSAVDLSKKLQKTMLQLKGEFMTHDGKGVNYPLLKQSQIFKEYSEKMAPLLQNVKLDNVNENEKKAFFINIYNALTIHGLAQGSEIPDSVLSVHNFWKTTGYNIAGLDYSLDDIEHGILRANGSNPGSTEPQFGLKDPRLKYIVKKIDPRIHFALVCGAKSCPAINVYTAENLDSALDAATRSFCSQEVSMFTEVDEIWLSKIFQWYREDFGKDDMEVIKWTVPYLDQKRQDRAHILMFKLDKMGQVDVKYNEYDWKLNSS